MQILRLGDIGGEGGGGVELGFCHRLKLCFYFLFFIFDRRGIEGEAMIEWVVDLVGKFIDIELVERGKIQGGEANENGK